MKEESSDDKDRSSRPIRTALHLGTLEQWVRHHLREAREIVETRHSFIESEEEDLVRFSLRIGR